MAIEQTKTTAIVRLRMASPSLASARSMEKMILRSRRHDEVDEGAEGYAGRPFGEPGLGVVVPGGAGDVQVNPGRVAGELLDEHGAGDGAAAFAAANVLDVGDGALDEFAVIVVDGHLPHFFANSFRTSEKLVREGLVGAENADVNVGEGHDDGAGESGGVDEMRGAELLGVVNAVGENEAAFRVGVENFDGLAGHGRLDVAGLLSFAPGHVFGTWDDANYFDAGLERGEGAHHAEHGGTAGHVVLHFFHALGRLDGDAAGIEGYRFADETDHRCAGLWLRRRVGDHHDAGRLGTTLSDAEERAHLEISDFLFVENFNGEASFLGHGFGFLSKDTRSEFVGRLVDEVAGKVLRVRDDAAPRKAFF